MEIIILLSNILCSYIFYRIGYSKGAALIENQLSYMINKMKFVDVEFKDNVYYAYDGNQFISMADNFEELKQMVVQKFKNESVVIRLLK